MRQAGILATRREGMNVYYRVRNPKLVQACGLMREALLDALDARRATPGAKILVSGGGRCNVTRDDRRPPVHAFVEWPLDVAGSRGYNYAEVTSGGGLARRCIPA